MEAVVIYEIYSLSQGLWYIIGQITQPPFVVAGKFVTKINVFLLFSVDEEYVFQQYFNRICAGGYKTLNTCVIFLISSDIKDTPPKQTYNWA